MACGSNVEIWCFRVFPFSTRSNQILWGMSQNTPSQILYELLVHLSTQKNGAGPRLIKFFSMNNKNYVAFQSKINNPTLQCNVSFMIKARFSIESNIQKIQLLVFSLRVIFLCIKHGMLLKIKIWWISRLSGCHPLLWTPLIYFLINKLLLTLTIFKTNIIFITEFSVKWIIILHYKAFLNICFI